MNRPSSTAPLMAICLLAACALGRARDELPTVDVAPTDQDFLKSAAEVYAFETQASDIALKQASTPEVKSYAQAMARDYSRANGELSALASRKSVDISQPLTANDQGLLHHLADLRGADFDQDYAQAVAVGIHVQAVSAFKAESSAGTDPDIKAWATRTLPTLQQHLQLARHLKVTTDDTADSPAQQ